jgi:hypothetical protein
VRSSGGLEIKPAPGYRSICLERAFFLPFQKDRPRAENTGACAQGEKDGDFPVIRRRCGLALNPAQERLQRDQAEHQAQLAARADQEKRTGKKPRGRRPEPPTGAVKDKEQVNLTDEDSRIMKVAGGGFDQCYNAQAVVATGSLFGRLLGGACADVRLSGTPFGRICSTTDR